MTGEELLESIKQQCNTASPIDFVRRLTNNVLLYAYIEKKFKERYPLEYAEWLKTQE